MHFDTVRCEIDRRIPLDLLGYKKLLPIPMGLELAFLGT